MSLLYKDEKDVKYSVEVKTTIDGKINLLFSADCGKFGTDEILDEHDLTVKHLLEILQAHEDKQCNIPDVIVPKNEGTVCPHCDGSGKDGHDRCDPPSWYICEKCDGSGRTAL